MRNVNREGRTLVTRALIGLLVALGSANATPLRVVHADANGVTLELEVSPWTLTAPDGRGRVRVERMPGAYELAEPGQPCLPAWSATIGLPPEADIRARVLSSGGGFAREAVPIVFAGRPTFPPSATGDGFVPALESVTAPEDGVWPASMVEIGKPFRFRGRRFVHVELRPFQYDATIDRKSVV